MKISWGFLNRSRNYYFYMTGIVNILENIACMWLVTGPEIRLCHLFYCLLDYSVHVFFSHWETEIFVLRVMPFSPFSFTRCFSRRFPGSRCQRLSIFHRRFCLFTPLKIFVKNESNCTLRVTDRLKVNNYSHSRKKKTLFLQLLFSLHETTSCCSLQQLDNKSLIRYFGV